MSSSLLKTITPANISTETRFLTAVSIAGAALTARANPKLFAAGTVVGLIIGLARGAWELHQHNKAALKDTSDSVTAEKMRNQANENLKPLPNRMTTLAIIFIVGLEQMKVRDPQGYIKWSALAAVPVGYYMGVFVDREVVSRFFPTDSGIRNLLQVGLKRQPL